MSPAPFRLSLRFPFASRVRALEPSPPPEPPAPRESESGYEGFWLRSNPRTRRLSLRLDPASGAFVLCKPSRASIYEALAFAVHNREWMESCLQSLPRRVRLHAGAELSFFGSRVELVADETRSRGACILRDAKLWVPGEAEMFEGRVLTWARTASRAVLTAEVNRLHAAAPPPGLRPVRSIRIADTAKRWGSCGNKGNISLSWRLVLAPPMVLEYVVAHEVAHLLHLNHGDDFWELVDAITPHRIRARPWLTANGDGLFRFGERRAKPSRLATDAKFVTWSDCERLTTFL